MGKFKILKIKINDVDNKNINRFISDRFYSALFFNILFILCIYASGYININEFLILPIFYITFEIIILYLVNKNIIKSHYNLLYFLVNILPSFFIFLFMSFKLLYGGYFIILIIFILIYIFSYIYFSNKNFKKFKQQLSVNLIKYIGIIMGGLIGGLVYKLDDKSYMLLWIIFLLFNLAIVQIKYEIKYVLKNNKSYGY